VVPYFFTTSGYTIGYFVSSGHSAAQVEARRLEARKPGRFRAFQLPRLACGREEKELSHTETQRRWEEQKVRR
jgi:hypothetical protein